MKADTTHTLLRELRRLAEPDELDERFHDELRALLLDRAQPRAGGERRRHRAIRSRPAFGVALAAAAIAAAGVTLSLIGGTESASADTVLRHAAALRFAPDQAVHLNYTVQMTLDGRTSTGNGDVWVQTNRQGAPTLVAETLTLSKVASGPAQLIERDIETPGGVYTYDAGHNTIEIPSRTVSSLPPRSPTVPLPAFLFDGATVAQRLQQLAAGAQGGARLLGQRTLDGVTVDAIQVDGWPNGGSLRTTFYFDTQTHVLRGFDVGNTDATYDAAAWQVRLASMQTTAAGSTPTSTFKLNAPANAWVQAPGLAKEALARLCPANLKPLLAQGQTLLEACRSATPGLTEAALVAALAGASKADLDAAVAAGQITPAQASQALAAEQAQLRAFVTSSSPAAQGPAPTTTAPSGK